jgi:hypothetical protein
VSDVKKYTPNSIANEIMAEDAWHDSLWVRDDDYEALRAELAEARRDAERWLWVWENDAEIFRENGEWWVERTDFLGERIRYEIRESRDAAIDAARKGTP